MLLARRRILIGASGIVCAGLAPARASEAEVSALIKQMVGESTLTPGRIKLDIPALIENGNAVAMTAGVEGAPATGPGRVARISVFAGRNPLPHVISATFGPCSGRARISTRIRLATSQTVIAVAKLDDGTCWSDSVDLLVTLAACIE